MKASVTTNALLAAKFAVAGFLLWWLSRSQDLAWSTVGIFASQPLLLALNCIVIALGVIAGALRWRMLLTVAQVNLAPSKASALQLMGLFFNIAVPGNIGGDALKAIYVARSEPQHKRADIYAVGLLDRAIGLASLATCALISTLIPGAPLGIVSQTLWVLAGTTAVGAMVMLFGVRLAAARWQHTRRWQTIAAHGRLIASAPRTLLYAFIIALGMHALGMTLFVALAHYLGGTGGTPLDIARVYPIGMLSLALPISYAGIGTGHAAFSRLFALIGATGGANVFNLFLIGQSLPCLLGVVPYVAMRSTQDSLSPEHVPTHK